ncbi:trypsin-like serine peptidase [Actinomadura kijaniata]|uniref:trypsin-like serine peptidase n=1 Tax=Actinomadura kijaniata TaxID=46161 RepID=UPI000B03846B|nr:trypsin-like serine protease [Actinomadura kijaniata]
MRKGQMRWTVAVVASTGVVAAGVGAVVHSRTNPPVREAADVAAPLQVSAAEADQTERYWTARRMTAAAPVAGRALQPQVGARAATPRGVPTAKAFGGVRTIGALFFTTQDKRDHYCTASVIASNSKRLLLTAAHCIHGGKGHGYVKNVAFVPKYDRGRAPYGVWTARSALVYSGWQKRGDPDLDFGFVTLNPRKGRNIQSVVGAYRLGINRGTGLWVNVAGNPKAAWDRRDRPIWCRVKTRRQSRYQIRMDCGGFYGGTSGSPWILNYNPRNNTGYVNGVLGGYQGGGNTHYTSYSPYFDKDIHNLRKLADSRA